MRLIAHVSQSSHGGLDNGLGMIMMHSGGVSKGNRTGIIGKAEHYMIVHPLG